MAIPAQDLYDFVAPHVGETGTCDEKLFMRALNQAMELLWSHGDWEGTVIRCTLPTDGQCCMTIPWQIEKIRTAWVGGNVTKVNDPFYETLQPWSLPNCSGCHECESIINMGISRPIPGIVDWPKKLAVQFNSTVDVGTTVTVHYVNREGISTKERITYVAGKVRYELPEHAYALLNVNKPVTDGSITLLAQDKCGDWERIAFYHPSQVNPRYDLIKAIGICPCQPVIVRAKLRRPIISSMDDMVPIESGPALALAVRAVNALGRNPDIYAALLKEAKSQLQMDILDDIQTEPVPIFLQTDRQRNLMPRR